jgi:hypothetical protein
MEPVAGSDASDAEQFTQVASNVVDDNNNLPIFDELRADRRMPQTVEEAFQLYCYIRGLFMA